MQCILCNAYFVFNKNSFFNTKFLFTHNPNLSRNRSMDAKSIESIFNNKKNFKPKKKMYKLINQILHHWVILMNNALARMYHCSTMIVHHSLGFLSIRTHQKIV